MMDILQLLGLSWPKILDLAFYLFDKAEELSNAEGVSKEEFNAAVDKRSIERDEEIKKQTDAELRILEGK